MIFLILPFFLFFLFQFLIWHVSWLTSFKFHSFWYLFCPSNQSKSQQLDSHLWPKYSNLDFFLLPFFFILPILSTIAILIPVFLFLFPYLYLFLISYLPFLRLSCHPSFRLSCFNLAALLTTHLIQLITLGLPLPLLWVLFCKILQTTQRKCSFHQNYLFLDISLLCLVFT